MSDAENSRASEWQPRDGTEHLQKRRINHILDMHDSVEEQAARAIEREIAGEVTRDARNIVLMKSVQKLIRECWNLLLEYDRGLRSGEENKYLNQHLGSIEFENGGGVEFVGLEEFLWAEEVYQEQWTEPVKSRHGPDQEETYSAQYTVPEEVSWRAYLLLRDFLNEQQGFEVQIEEFNKSREGKFKYEDLLQDGSPDASTAEPEVADD